MQGGKSAASADSHEARTSPASELIRSEEPTLTTMRRNFFSDGRAMRGSNEGLVGQSNTRHLATLEVARKR